MLKYLMEMVDVLIVRNSQEHKVMGHAKLMSVKEVRRYYVMEHVPLHVIIIEIKS